MVRETRRHEPRRGIKMIVKIKNRRICLFTAYTKNLGMIRKTRTKGETLIKARADYLYTFLGAFFHTPECSSYLFGSKSGSSDLIYFPSSFIQ